MDEVLKQFTILFSLDNTPLKEGLSDSQRALNSFASFAKQALATYLTFDFLKDAVDNFNQLNLTLSNTSKLTGVNAFELAALGGALTRFGGDTQTAVSAIKSINQHLHEARFGSGALIEVAKKYGLVISKQATAEQTLLSLAKQMGRYDKQTRIAIASQLGLDEAMQLAFADGGKELEQLIQKQKELNLVNPEDIKLTNKLTYAMLDLKDMFSALTRDLARVILPSFTKLLELISGFIDFLRRHKVFVMAFFAGILIAVSPLLLMFTKMAIASVAAFAPFYAIGAVIAGIALVFEDLLYYFQGYDSVTGKLVERFPLLKSLIEPLRPIVLSIYKIFKSIIALFKDPSLDNLTKVFTEAGKFLIELIKSPLEAIINIVDMLIAKFPVLKVLLEPIKIIVETIVQALKSVLDILSNLTLNELTESLSNFSDKAVGFLKDLNPFADNKDLASVRIPETPIMPQSAQVNDLSDNQNVSNYNITNNINQSISSATPKQLADSSNRIFINSINQQRQQNGGLLR